MDTSRIPYFICVLLCTHVVGASNYGNGTVLPPTKVTLHCHNMQNTLSWKYDEPQQGLRFKVFVGSLTRDPVILWVNAPNMSIDLSQFSEPDTDYGVMVSAVKENVESDEAPEDGLNYSYFKDSPAAIKCSLDLPSVNVSTLEENNLHFSFTHPGVFYLSPQRSRKKKSQEYQNSLPVFDYRIKVINQGESHKYHCVERECQGKLQVYGSEKSYCLNISGEMKKMSVRATKKYCSEPLKQPGINFLIYIIPIVMVLCGGTLIGFMVYIKKTRPLTSGPAVLDFRGKSPHQQKHTSLENTDYHVVEPYSPVPLITPEQDTSNDSIPRDGELRLPCGGCNVELEPEQEEEAAEAQGAPDDNYTQGNCLDNEGEEENGEGHASSAYEFRERLVPNQNDTQS